MKLLDRLFRKRPPILDTAATWPISSTRSPPFSSKRASTSIRARARATIPRSCSRRRRSPNRSSGPAGAPIRWGSPWSAKWSRACCAIRLASRRRIVLDRLTELVLSVFDRYPVPPSIGPGAWREMRDELATAPRPRRRPRAQACDRHSGAAGGGLLRADADPRKAARPGFPDNAELSAGQSLQHPRGTGGARKCAGHRRGACWRRPE